MKRVIEQTRRAALDRVEKLGEEKALAGAVPPKLKNAAVFEPLEGGYEEKPIPIRRTTVNGY
jgi:hypothetical protein